MTTFQATGAYVAAQGLSDLFKICLQNDDVQDFDTRQDQIPFGTSELPHENVLEGLYNMKLQGSDQLQTVLALYKQEMNRDKVTPSYQRLRTMVRQRIDPTIRTRTFQSPEWKIWDGSVGQVSQRKKRQRGKNSGRMLSVESNWTMFKGRLL